MLEEIRDTYIKCADAIPDWRDTSVNILCNKYIDNEKDEVLRSAYFSAIVLKKWAYIGKHYASSKASGFSIEDCYDMVIHGIMYALEKRKWKDPNNKLFNDKCAPDKVLNRCIASSRDIDYYLSNTDKRRANHGKSSLDQIEENVRDCTEVIADNSAEESGALSELRAKMLIETLVKKDRLVEALIVNNIIEDDCFVEKSKTEKFMFEDEEQKVKKYSYHFKAGKLINNLYNYKESNILALAKNYKLDEERLKGVAKLFTSPKNTFARVIKNTLAGMSQDSLIKKYLCL